MSTLKVRPETRTLEARAESETPRDRLASVWLLCDLAAPEPKEPGKPRRPVNLALVLDRPAIGCAKSRLIGTHVDPGAEAGSWVELRDDGEVVGLVVRSKQGANPLYISVGHKADLPTAMQHVLACCRGYRLPETTRQAHMAASQRTGLSSLVEKSLF